MTKLTPLLFALLSTCAVATADARPAPDGSFDGPTVIRNGEWYVPSGKFYDRGAPKNEEDYTPRWKRECGEGISLYNCRKKEGSDG